MLTQRHGRRGFIALGLGSVATLWLSRHKLRSRLSAWTHRKEFDAPPPLLEHDPQKDRRTLAVARGGSVTGNIDEVLTKLGGIGTVVRPDDVVLLKVSAQWWNQGMTNVAAVKRVIEHVLGIPGFSGEVVVFENTHFRLADGSGLSRAWTHPSERNVDVPGWNKLGDLVPHFAALGSPVSFVGLVDAGPSELAGNAWQDPTHAHGVYGGDGRGPIGPGEIRDGYHWDLDQSFRLRRSLVDFAQTPLTWPRFTSPFSGRVIDLRDGVLRREGDRLVADGRRLTFIAMTTANEHDTTGFTGCCKSAMGLVDMSAGEFGTDPRVRGYRCVHMFGWPSATWRLAGPLAHFARKVRAPDLYLTVAEWVGATPKNGWDRRQDPRLELGSAFRAHTVVGGKDPVAIDSWVVRNLLMPLAGGRKHLYDLDSTDSLASCFLRYYRQVYGMGTLEPALIQIV